MKKYLVIIETTETGYGAYVPDLPGCIATASTRNEVERMIYEGIQFHIQGLELEGLPIPVASSEAETMVFAH